MIIAGETSGDLHGAKLVKAMQKRNKGLFFCGIGGQALKETGVDILIDAREISVVGITEVFSKIPNILRSLGMVKKTFKTMRPDLLILIDFPDFNLHVAATAQKMGIPVLYYISPQIWAWRPGRVKKIDKLVDHMAVILPFEEDFYRKQKIQVTFVGHPLLENSLPTKERIEDKWMNDIPAIGLLPGSREQRRRGVLRHSLARGAAAAQGLGPDAIARGDSGPRRSLVPGRAGIRADEKVPGRQGEGFRRRLTRGCTQSPPRAGLCNASGDTCREPLDTVHEVGAEILRLAGDLDGRNPSQELLPHHGDLAPGCLGAQLGKRAELAWPRLPSSDHLAIGHPERRHGVQNLAPNPRLESL